MADSRFLAIGAGTLALGLQFGSTMLAFLRTWMRVLLLVLPLTVISGNATENDVPEDPAEALLARIPRPDTSDWSEKRIRDYQALLAAQEDAIPEGLIRIPAIDIELPVYSGTQESSLTLGAGRIEGTPPLGSAGNTGIAGHRDGYFRALQNISVGDSIRVETPSSSAEYQIVELLVVNPEDIHVLDETETDSLTLVTCYPFYFEGHAPQRFIVRAHKR